MNGGAGDGGFVGVDGNGDFDLGGEALNDGEDAVEFFGFGDRSGAGAGGFAADVEDVSALVDERKGLGDSMFNRKEAAAVRE